MIVFLATRCLGDTFRLNAHTSAFLENSVLRQVDIVDGLSRWVDDPHQFGRLCDRKLLLVNEIDQLLPLSVADELILLAHFKNNQVLNLKLNSQ